MNFVKSGVYLQKFTKDGVKEQEIDTRDPAEREAERRLRKLPEFTTDPNFKSLAEQLEETEEEPLAEPEAYYYGPATATTDDVEFLEGLKTAAERKQAARNREDAREISEFRKSAAASQIHRFGIETRRREADPDEPPPPDTTGSLQCSSGPRVTLLIRKRDRQPPVDNAQPIRQGDQTSPSSNRRLLSNQPASPSPPTTSSSQHPGEPTAPEIPRENECSEEDISSQPVKKRSLVGSSTAAIPNCEAACPLSLLMGYEDD